MEKVLKEEEVEVEVERNGDEDEEREKKGKADRNQVPRIPISGSILFFGLSIRSSIEHVINEIERQLTHSPTQEWEAFNAAVIVVDGLAAIRTAELGTEAIVDSIVLFISCFDSLSVCS